MNHTNQQVAATASLWRALTITTTLPWLTCALGGSDEDRRNALDTVRALCQPRVVERAA